MRAVDFIALKNLSPSAGFKPANLGFNIKHANHYTTEDNKILDTESWNSDRTELAR
jgi:hypothetical protein